MNRIATGLPIAVAALAMNGGFVGDGYADQAAPVQPKVVAGRTADMPQVTETRGSRVLALVVALRALQIQAQPGR